MEFLYNNFIASFFLWVLQWLYNLINEYSITIIVVALFIRLFLLPLDIKQRISTKKMIAINPQVENIRKRYANNPDQLNARINKLYKENGISTLAGCLPMLLQIVFLFAFYGALRTIATRETVSLVLKAAENGAESVNITGWLWVHNLWQPDSGMAQVLPTAAEFLNTIRNNSVDITPQTIGILKGLDIVSFANNTLSINEPVYTALCNNIISVNNLTGIGNGWFILPLISAGSMLLQQMVSTKLNPNPQTAQTMGAMKYIYPIISFMICLSSNAMFSIYWAFTSIYSVLVDVLFNFYYKKKMEKAGK